MVLVSCVVPVAAVVFVIPAWVVGTSVAVVVLICWLEVGHKVVGGNVVVVVDSMVGSGLVVVSSVVVPNALVVSCAVVLGMVAIVVVVVSLFVTEDVSIGDVVVAGGRMVVVNIAVVFEKGSLVPPVVVELPSVVAISVVAVVASLVVVMSSMLVVGFVGRLSEVEVGNADVEVEVIVVGVSVIVV